MRTCETREINPEGNPPRRVANPPPFMRSPLYGRGRYYGIGASGAEIRSSRARIRGHLIARLTWTTPTTICLGEYHRSALSRPIRHARRLTTCRNRAHSLLRRFTSSRFTPLRRGSEGDIGETQKAETRCEQTSERAKQ